jgi:hypothetical protein
LYHQNIQHLELYKRFKHQIRNKNPH